VQYAAYHQPVGGSYQWNLQFQRQVNNNLVASLAYVASHGHNLPFPVDINQVPVGKLAQNDQQFRPYPQFGTIATAGAVPNENAISNYNSLQATIEQRLSHGLNFSFSYVWSHFLDDLDSAGWGSHSGNTNWQNGYNPSANYGNSNFDVRNAFKGYILYQLPFGRGRQFLNSNSLVDAVIGGWQISDTLVVQSGQPFTPVMQTDTSYALSQSSSGFVLYPNLIGNPTLANRGVRQWFNEAAFVPPTAGTFGNVHRNQLTGPGLTTTNLSLSKTFSIWEEVKLQVRGDAQNLFNHPSFGLPANQLTVVNGAVVTGSSTINSVTVPSRTMQVSARLSF
jgi:hypothetical protein